MGIPDEEVAIITWLPRRPLPDGKNNSRAFDWIPSRRSAMHAANHSRNRRTEADMRAAHSGIGFDGAIRGQCALCSLGHRRNRQVPRRRLAAPSGSPMPGPIQPMPMVPAVRAMGSYVALVGGFQPARTMPPANGFQPVVPHGLGLFNRSRSNWPSGRITRLPSNRGMATISSASRVTRGRTSPAPANRATPSSNSPRRSRTTFKRRIASASYCSN